MANPQARAFTGRLAVGGTFLSIVFLGFYVGMQKLRLPPFKQALCLWILCGLVLVWALHTGVSLPRPRWTVPYVATDTRMDSILIGCALRYGTIRYLTN